MWGIDSFFLVGPIYTFFFFWGGVIVLVIVLSDFCWCFSFGGVVEGFIGFLDAKPGCGEDYYHSPTEF